MSRKRHPPPVITEQSEPPPSSTSDFPDFSDMEPVSMPGTKFAGGNSIAIIMSGAARKKSRLPFVSWEPALREDHEALARGIDYPRELSDQTVSVQKNHDERSKLLNMAIRKASDSKLPHALGLSKASFKHCFPNPKRVRTSNPAFNGIFASWNVREKVLLECAHIEPRRAIDGRFVHLIAPKKPRLRFMNSLVGVDPHLLAWRMWLDFQDNVAPCDCFMDLLSFAWLTLQFDLLYDSYVIGGTYVQEGDDHRILCAWRSTHGWFVDELRESQRESAAVLLMSR